MPGWLRASSQAHAATTAREMQVQFWRERCTRFQRRVAISMTL